MLRVTMSDPASIRALARASAKREAAERAYRDALVRAVEELQAAGVRDAYARAALAAGTTRQAVRELYMRATGTWKG
jgi:hypothetical protein